MLLSSFRRVLRRLVGRRTAVGGGFAPPRPADRGIRELAQHNARSSYQGLPEGEPHVAHQLQALGSYLTRLFRTDETLRTAQAAAVDAGHRLDDATNELPRTIARTQDALQQAVGILPTADDPMEAARWTDAARARAERRDAEDAVAAARRAHANSTRQLGTVESRSIDRLADAAAAGLVPINTYLAAFDQARADLALQGIGLLGEDMVHRLVRRAVRPIDLGAADEAAA